MRQSQNEGKIPPHSIQAEEIVLGQLLLDEMAYDEIAGILTHECFYKEQHRQIFKAMTELYKKQEPINLLTLVNKLMGIGMLDAVGGPHFISEMSSKVSSAKDIEHHAAIVYEKHIRREILRTSHEAINNAYDETKDIYDTVEQIQSDTTNLFTQRSKTVTVGEAFQKSIKATTDKNSPVQYIPSKFEFINKKTGGYGCGQLTTVAARPGHGKTTWILNEALHMARMGIKSTVFSLEMKPEEIACKIASIITGIAPKKIKKGELTEQEWNAVNLAERDILDLPIDIETEYLTYSNIRSMVRKAIRRGSKIVFIDYLQLIGLPFMKGKSETDLIGLISRELKKISMELDFPVVLLSQLNREIEKRPPMSRIPRSHDIRSSGSVEQDSDVVIGLMNPEKYSIDEYEGESMANKYIPNVDKNRNGETGWDFVGIHNYMQTICDIQEIEINKGQEKLPF